MVSNSLRKAYPLSQWHPDESCSGGVSALCWVNKVTRRCFPVGRWRAGDLRARLDLGMLHYVVLLLDDGKIVGFEGVEHIDNDM